MKKCKNCGSENNDLSVYCTSCGTMLDSSASDFSAESTASFSESDFSASQNTQSPPQNNNYQQNYQTGANQGAYQQNGFNPTYGQQGYNQQSGYAAPSDSFYSPIAKPPVSKGKVIAALIVGVLCGGLLGLIFAVLALVAYGDYDSAVARGDYATAQQKAEKIKTYNKLAWIFDIIGIVIVVLAVAAFFAFTFFVVSDPSFMEGIEEIPFEDFEYYYEYDNLSLNLGAVASYIGLC
ncbi:MAG: hypothetical protein ACI4F5_00195 [Acutalibacteraceae bacterium]